MIIEDSFEQQSEAWYKAKAGLPSASNFKKIVRANGGPSDSAKAYMHRLAGERVVGRYVESYASYDMKEGVKKEPEARWVYEQICGVKVQQVALVYKNENRNVICSPDGLMPGRGLEIKCPNLENQVQSLIDRKLPADKHRQVYGSMWVCGFQEWDFFSYYPGLPSLLLTVKRDDDFIAKLEAEMIKFLKGLNEVYAELKGA